MNEPEGIDDIDDSKFDCRSSVFDFEIIDKNGIRLTISITSQNVEGTGWKPCPGQENPGEATGDRA